MESVDVAEAPDNQYLTVNSTVQNRMASPEIVVNLSLDDPIVDDKTEHPQITQSGVKIDANEENAGPDVPERGQSQLDMLKVDLERQRRRSVELTEDMQNVERLKAQRERETHEVKKREMMPSFGTILQKKCREIFEEIKDMQNVGNREETLILLTKLILMQAPKSQESDIFSVSEIAEPYRMRAEIYLEMCDFQSAILNYKKVCSLLPDETKHFERLAFMYFFYGQVLFDQGQFPEALECFSRAAEMQPDTVGYHTRSVACLASLQRHGECLALVNRRIEVEADNPDLFVMRARLHQLFGNSTLCYYDVRDALELDPELKQAKELRKVLFDKAIQLKDQAVSLLLENKLQEALRKMSQAIDHDPTVAEFHVLRGSINRRMSNFNNAVDDFLLALDKTDHDESSPIYQSGIRQLILSYNDFGIQCFNRGYFDEAISLFNKAIRAEKSEKGLYINRGDCFFKMKNYHFSLADYQQALELDTDDWDVKSRISLIFNEFGIMDYFERRYLEAERKFTLALQHNPKVSQYYISRSRVRHLLDFKRGAREDVLCALHLAPTNEELFSLIARLFPGKSLMEIKASPLFDATVKKLNNMFQLCAPKRPILRPVSSMSATSQLAASLSSELPVVLPSSLSPSRQDHRSASSRKAKSGSSRRSQSSHKEESSRKGYYNEDRDSESHHETKSPPPRRNILSGDRLVKEPYSPSETQPLDMEALTTTKEFMKRRKQLNDNVKKMLDSSTSLGSIKSKPSVLVNAPKRNDSSTCNRWGSAKRSIAKQ